MPNSVVQQFSKNAKAALSDTPGVKNCCSIGKCPELGKFVQIQNINAFLFETETFVTKLCVSAPLEPISNCEE